MSDFLGIQQGQVKTICIWYEVTKCLGRGRFSDVYKAYNSKSNIDVALKIYKNHNEKYHAIAKREHDILKRLNDLNVPYFPIVHQFPKYRKPDTNAHYPVLVMELGQYVSDSICRDTITLKDILPVYNSQSNESVELKEFWDGSCIARWIISLCDSISLLHKNGIIHRDLKPENILLKRHSGQDSVQPFILDFNTSIVPDEPIIFSGGTQRYLPPEVISHKRTVPDVNDDIWSLARIIWEVLFGLEADINSGIKHHKYISQPFVSTIINVLLKALSADISDRYPDIDAFSGALKDVLKAKEGLPSGTISEDELAWARQAFTRIKYTIIDEISSDEDLPVPKEVRKQVESCFSCINNNHTESFDLKEDIISLNTRAIPAIFEESYKVCAGTKDFYLVAEALAELSQNDLKLAERSIIHYCEYSNYNIRSLCWELCKKMRMFPSYYYKFLDQDRVNDVLLPDERVLLADLCIDYSNDQDAIMVLDKYMCMEYIEDINRYYNLKERIAERLVCLQFPDKGLLLIEDCKNHIWEELENYQRLSLEERLECDKGLLQLIADAFAEFGEEALNLLQCNSVPEKCKNGTLFIKRHFAKKLVEKYPPAFNWLKHEIEINHTVDRSYKWVWDKVGKKHAPIDITSSKNLFDDWVNLRITYLPQELWDNYYIFSLIDEKLRHSVNTKVINKILDLLLSFKNRKRILVVKKAIDYWDLFASVDYKKLIDIVSKYQIQGDLRSEVLEILNQDLNTDKYEIAHEGIERLLKEVEN